MRQYFVRIGVLGEIRLASALIPIERFRRVVIRSPRGIEVGEVISPHRPQPSGERESATETAYRIVRPTTESDELLVRRLDRYKRQAIEACRERLGQAGAKVALLDVDQLLDGGTLLMHFLGDVDAVAEEISREVAREYESVVRTNHLSELLQDGCGPDCGTSNQCGTSCGSCAGCGT